MQFNVCQGIVWFVLVVCFFFPFFFLCKELKINVVYSCVRVFFSCIFCLFPIRLICFYTVFFCFSVFIVIDQINYSSIIINIISSNYLDFFFFFCNWRSYWCSYCFWQMQFIAKTKIAEFVFCCDICFFCQFAFFGVWRLFFTHFIKWRLWKCDIVLYGKLCLYIIIIKFVVIFFFVLFLLCFFFLFGCGLCTFLFFYTLLLFGLFSFFLLSCIMHKITCCNFVLCDLICHFSPFFFFHHCEYYHLLPIF